LLSQQEGFGTGGSEKNQLAVFILLEQSCVIVGEIKSRQIRQWANKQTAEKNPESILHEDMAA